MSGPRLAAVIGAPLAMLLAGGALGYVMRPDEQGAVTTAGRTGVALPTGGAFEAYAPVRQLATAPAHAVYDPADVVGFDPGTRVTVRKGGALPLALDATGDLIPVDVATLQPVTDASTPGQEPADPAPLSDVGATAPTPNTLAPPATEPAPTTTVVVKSFFVDPCIGSLDPCVGQRGDVRTAASRTAVALEPLRLTLPFAAAGGFSSLCDTIESSADGVPDPFLGAAVRPTIGVVLNQPATIALSGRWSDGASLQKLTMATSPDLDAQWQSVWTKDHRQLGILACITLPLDTVRAHASAGRATVNTHLLAISASGRGEIDGPVTLTVPLDGDDLRFVDQLRFDDAGRQRQTDGTLAATVHVHYAFTSDTMVPAGRLDPRSAHIYGRTAFVENADCAGWAQNQQGLDRTASGAFGVAFEDRTVSGRQRPVTVVDGVVRLDSSMAPGWQGFVCTQVFAADASGTRETLVLRGAEVRSPLTPQYRVGAVIDDAAFPSGTHLDLTWTRVDRSPLCNGMSIASGSAERSAGASCSVSSDRAPDGIVLGVHAVTGTGAAGAVAAVTVTVPVNLTACNPDDRYGATVGACSTGFRQRVDVPLTADGSHHTTVTVVVDRDTTPGSMSTDPAHEWRIAETRSFSI